MEELLKNAEEFFESGEENIKKHRFNVAVSDFFKSIVIMCDYLIYTQIKVFPKNHSERFSLLKNYFNEIYKNISILFKLYTKSYNLRLGREEADKVKDYANELRKYIKDKK